MITRGAGWFFKEIKFRELNFFRLFEENHEFLGDKVDYSQGVGAYPVQPIGEVIDVISDSLDDREDREQLTQEIEKINNQYLKIRDDSGRSEEATKNKVIDEIKARIEISRFIFDFGLVKSDSYFQEANIHPGSLKTLLKYKDYFPDYLEMISGCCLMENLFLPVLVDNKEFRYFHLDKCLFLSIIRRLTPRNNEVKIPVLNSLAGVSRLEETLSNSEKGILDFNSSLLRGNLSYDLCVSLIMLYSPIYLKNREDPSLISVSLSTFVGNLGNPSTEIVINLSDPMVKNHDQFSGVIQFLKRQIRGYVPPHVVINKRNFSDLLSEANTLRKLSHLLQFEFGVSFDREEDLE